MLLFNNLCRLRTYIKILKTRSLLKITPAPDPILIKHIHSWSCSGSCKKRQTPVGVDTVTPGPAHLCSQQESNSSWSATFLLKQEHELNFLERSRSQKIPDQTTSVLE